MAPRTAPTAAALSAPPCGVFPKPPAEPLAAVLPFGELTWENFERLCYQLARRVGQIDDVARYGRQGQAQGGIDIFARKTNGRYDVWQSKRYTTFGPVNVRRAVKAFRDGRWLKRTDKFYLAVQARLDDVVLQDEIEAQAKTLANDGVVLIVLGGDALSDRLRPYPELVHAFFGRVWLKAFYGDALDPGVATTLDGPEFARVRAQLARVYETRFNALDPAAITTSFGLDPAAAVPMLGLLDRYAVPDIVLRERRAEASGPAQAASAPSTSALTQERKDAPVSGPTTPRETLRRTPVADWLAEGDQIAVVADAGAGKSTLLRCIALDLLSGQTVFPGLATRWGDRLPIFVPFAKWARETAAADGEVGLKELVASVLQPLLTVDLVSLVNRAVDEGRIVLLVDGLDEWIAEQPARIAFQTLITYAEVHDLPTIASGRPSGLRRIGALPQAWKVGELASLSAQQQRDLAKTWFHHQHRHRSDDGTAEVAANWSASRFLSELKRDGALAELAGNPLMFVGLLALAMRQVALPRDRCQALGSLVQILLDVHPQSRATAAGDVRPRFEHASLEVRQGALGALAFASRRDGGDAGYPRDQASEVIVAHLTEVADFTPAHARAVADEVLAINAETVGLLVEKAPGEIGFAHASLDEFLGAEHVQSWPLAEVLAFASAHAGSPRWRNVLRNLVALNKRPNEIDEIVAQIENTQLDVVGDIDRRRLLAEVAFGPSAMRSGTALRLASVAFATIDEPGFFSERVDLARIALSGLGHPTLGAEVCDRIDRWAPRRFRFGSAEFDALRRWPLGPDLLDTLFAGLSDDEEWVKQAAARSLAAKYGGDAAVEQRLKDLVGGRADLETIVAAIEALVRGWPKTNLDALLAAAGESRVPRLRALALFGRVIRGQRGDTELELCFELLLPREGLQFKQNGILGEALALGWPNDARVVARALRDIRQRHEPNAIDYDVALSYLLNTTSYDPKLCDWILAQLDEKYPFIGLLGQSWDFLPGFAEADPRIHERVVAYVLEQSEHHEHGVWPIIAEINDVRLRDHAIARVRATGSSSRYWSLLPLVRGWKGDAEVEVLLGDLRALPDDELDMVVALLPEFYEDAVAARARLLRVAQHAEKLRVDLLIRAFEEVGCSAQDHDVVDALLKRFSRRANFQDMGGIFLLFGEHPQVRAVALRELEGPRQPLVALVQAYGNDDEIRALLRRRLTPASASVRYVIAEASAVDADRHPALLSVLEKFDAEVDFDLRVQLAIYYSALRQAQGPTTDLEAQLLVESDRRGMDFEEARAAAFAGLVQLGRAASFDRPSDVGRQVRLGDPIGGQGSPALGRLIVEHWPELVAALGDDWLEHWVSDENAWQRLSRYVGGHAAARRAFLDWCALAKNLGPAALQTLAELDPGSDVLRGHVTATLRTLGSNSPVSLEALIASAEIVRDQFLDLEIVADAASWFECQRDGRSAVVLAILAPSHPSLKGPKVTAVELGAEFGAWLIGAYITAWLEPIDQVLAFVTAMVRRRVAPGYENRDLINRVLANRIARDLSLAELLDAARETPLDVESFCVIAQLLANAGKFSDAWRAEALARLQAELAAETLPTIIFDIAADAHRPAAHTLLDIIQASGPA